MGKNALKQYFKQSPKWHTSYMSLSFNCFGNMNILPLICAWAFNFKWNKIPYYLHIHILIKSIEYFRLYLQRAGRRLSRTLFPPRGWCTRWAAPAARGSCQFAAAAPPCGQRISTGTSSGADVGTTSSTATSTPRPLLIWERKRRTIHASLRSWGGWWWTCIITRQAEG